MFRSNTIKGLMMGLLVLSLMLVGLGITWSPVAAAHPGTGQWECEVEEGGVWLGSTPNEDGGICITDIDASRAEEEGPCPAGDTLVLEWDADDESFDTADPHCSSEYAGVGVGSEGADGSTPNYGMERKGICKLMDMSDGYFGGYITATVKGSPSFLLLKLDGKTFKLPVVPGTVVANGDGTSTAQFYTMDPATGQALVPAGEYMVRCSGGSGSNDGSNNTITIGY